MLSSVIIFFGPKFVNGVITHRDILLGCNARSVSQLKFQSYHQIFQLATFKSENHVPKNVY
jgi:hypothetical protein